MLWTHALASAQQARDRTMWSCMKVGLESVRVGHSWQRPIPGRPCATISVLVVCLVCVWTPAEAQGASATGHAAISLSKPERSSPRGIVPLHEKRSTLVAEGFVLPAAPALSPQTAPLSQRSKLFLRELHIEGSTVFPRSRLAEVVAPYIGRQVSSRDLQELRYQLTLLYVNNGYITSGAVIPDQPVENGVITLHIIEGRLVDVEVTGNERLKTDYIRERVLLSAGPPLNINALKKTLQLLNQDPLIARLNSQLAPGVRLGESVLRVAVQEAQPYSGTLAFNNRRSPSVGSK